MGLLNWNIYKIKAPLGYGPGEKLYGILKAIYDAMAPEDKVPAVMMLLTLVYDGSGDPVVYPLKVLNVSGTDLGQADTAAQYMSIWNSDATNRLKGVIISANNLTFEFAPVALNTQIELKADPV